MPRPTLAVLQRATTGVAQACLVSVRSLFKTLLAIAFALSGCTDNDTLAEPPPRLLSQQQMVSFLIDLHLAEAKMNYTEVRKTDSLEVIFRHYERHLMDQHGFSDSVYLRSYEYYLDHMGLMNKIYDDVVDSLNIMNSQLQMPEPEITGDTL